LAPITPEVVSWAVDRSGYSVEEIASAIGQPADAIKGWLDGSAQPTVSQAKALAAKLKRPFALLLWSTPPKDDLPQIAFRAPVASEMRDLNPVERRYIRQAVRLQDAMIWVRQELNDEPFEFPGIRADSNTADAAEVARSALGISIDTQLGWTTEYEAFRQWRAMFEARGLCVFSLSLGVDSCRGMTLASEQVPIIVINTEWNPNARIFTLFHELGHVLSRTTSACATSWAKATEPMYNPVERWCEEFAASALMPLQAVEAHLRRIRVSKVTDIRTVGAIARAFKVSMQAATLRLIETNHATWKLWDQIPRDSNAKSSGGGAGAEARTTPVIRLGEFGRATAEILIRGMRADVLDRSQVASYLRVNDDALGEIEQKLANNAAVETE
ncbi:MAG TPA: ImmA/IrrE family metallo-endopeptidase, partial [Burkholderiales bacterium]|nr:ImmA/IrrE family metallo-endopeptidase [Burkholderiales bacterium]